MLSSSSRAPLKRGRSSSPDDEAKPSVPQPERKKPKLMTGGNRLGPSPNKRHLLQLLRRQKKVMAAPLGKINASFTVGPLLQLMP